MKRRLLLLFLLMLGLLVVQPAEAGKNKGKNGNGNDQAVTTVTSVDVANSRITLTIADNKQAIIYQIPLGTALTIDGSTANLSQIKSGMHVVSYTEADSGTLSQLDVTRDKAAK
jgi:hypothetical protein